MPLFRYTCPACGTEVRRILPAPPDTFPCPKCGADVRRTPKPPTSNVVERLDNGFMARAVERPADAERLYKERSDAADPNKIVDE